MNSSFLISLFHWFNYIADSLFTGLKIFGPLVFLFKLFDVSIKYPDFNLLIKAMNTLMLTGAIMFMTGIIANYYMMSHSENPMDKEFMVNLITGPHWFQLAIPVLLYGVLPNMFWIKKLRNSINTAMILVVSWFAGFYLIDYLSFKDENNIFQHERPLRFPIDLSVEKSIVFVTLLILFYLILSWKEKRKVAPGN